MKTHVMLPKPPPVLAVRIGRQGVFGITMWNSHTDHTGSLVQQVQYLADCHTYYPTSNHLLRECDSGYQHYCFYQSSCSIQNTTPNHTGSFVQWVQHLDHYWRYPHLLFTQVQGCYQNQPHRQQDCVYMWWSSQLWWYSHTDS